MGVATPRADVRLLLPLEAGQQVVVPAGEAALAAAAAADGLVVTNVTAAPWPLPDGTADHVLLPALDGASMQRAVPEAARVLKPGGNLLIGVANRHSLYRWLPGRQAATPSLATFSLRQAQRWLARHDFAPWASYGVRQGVHEPTLLVPLAVAAPTRFFFRQRFIPYSTAGRLLPSLAGWLATLQQHAALFRDLLLVCRRLPTSA